MIPKEDTNWYRMYVHPEKYDVSKWGAYRKRINSGWYEPEAEEDLVQKNMKCFHKEGSNIYSGCTDDDRSDRPLDHLFDYLQTKNLIESGQQMFSYKDETELLKELKGCKVLIVTANENEKNILHYKVAEQRKETAITRIIFGNVAYFIFRWEAYKVAHVHQHQMGANRDLGMRKTLEEVFSVFRPNVVFSMGVAFGIDPQTQNIGDVLVSHKIFPYSENKVNDDSILPDRSQDKIIDNWLDVRFANTTGFLEDVTYGSILSGGSVLSSTRDKLRICRAYSEQDFVIGGEMEGSALFQLCASYDIPCAVIKGICDWGTCKNGVYCDNSDLECDDTPQDYDSHEKEAHLKTCAQAYAMMQVFEKCNVLFRDSTLFNHPKTRAIDMERKISNRLLGVSIASNAAILLILLFKFWSIQTMDNLVCSNITVYTLICAISVVAFLAAIVFCVLGRNRYLH